MLEHLHQQITAFSMPTDEKVKPQALPCSKNDSKVNIMGLAPCKKLDDSHCYLHNDLHKRLAIWYSDLSNYLLIL